MNIKKDRPKALKVLALGLAGLLLAPQAALAGETRTYDGDGSKLRTIGGVSNVFGPMDLTSVTGNTLIIDYIPGTNPALVVGAFSVNADVSGNSVIFRSGSVNSTVYGGFSIDGSAAGNSVTISGGSIGFVYGGYSDNGSATGNTVTISGASIGGYVLGGYSDNGSATGNTVTINNSSIGMNVFGGVSTDGSATGNSVTISGGSIGGYVYGGRSTNGSATGNSVTISGNPTLTNSVLYGGFGAGDVVTGNTLNVRNSGLAAKGVANFQYYNFYLPPALSNGGTMLSVSDPADIHSSTIGIGFLGNTSLQPGDKVTLLNSTGGLTATGINTRASGMAGIARIYDFALSIEGSSLKATVSGVSQNPQVKALSEGQISAVAFLCQGADILSGQGMSNARGAAAGAGGQPTGFTAMGGAGLRYETGSHVDVDGCALVLGVARQTAATDSTRLNGIFLETGWGSYSTYNDFVNASSVRGEGDTRYLGAGWLGRRQKKDGQYLEGSLRAGRVSNRFNSGDFGANAADYDIHAPYYGLHIGFGKEKDLGSSRKLDIYTKLLWSHQNGSNATVQGDAFDFAAVDSYRWQTGAKLSRKVNEHTTLYTGLVYQYEFDGQANATVNGSAIEAPGMQGGTGIVELGVTIDPKRGGNTPALDLSLQGFAGKCQGIAGSVQATWKF